jgi:hypothetical protein
MQLTHHERRLVEKLKKRERQWPWMRWVFLLGGVLLCLDLAFYGFLLGALLHDLDFGHPTLEAILKIAVLWPKCLVELAIAVGVLGIAVRDWHGNANRMLLLRLLEAQESQTEAEPGGPALNPPFKR